MGVNPNMDKIDTIQFDSYFESGNLDLALKVNDYIQ
jgi:hypothetical protein